jgi:hypothetical protein
MMNFLKSFLAGEKSPAENELLDAQKKHDVLTLDAYAMEEDEDDEESCAPQGGCGGCGCHR